MGSALREIVASFGVNVDSKDLDALDGQISSVIEKLGAMGAAFAAFGAAKGFVSFMEGQVETAFQLDRTAEKLGTTTDALQGLRFSASLAGESAEKFDTALRFLEKNMGSAEIGAKSASKEYARLGLEVRGADGHFVSMEDQLLNAADAIAKLETPAQKTRAAMALFGRAGAEVLPWLLKGSTAIKAQVADFKNLGGGMTRDFIEKAKEAAVQGRRFDAAMTSLKATFAEQFLPSATKVVTWLVEFAGQAKYVVEHTNAIAVGVKFLEAVLVGGALRAMYAFVSTMTLATLEMAAWVGGFALLYLLVEDLSIALDGGKSIIGEYLEKIMGTEGAHKALDSLRDGYTKIKDEMGLIGPASKSASADLIDAFSGALPYVVDAFLASLHGVLAALQGMVGVAKLLKGTKQWLMADTWEEYSEADKTFARAGKNFDGAGREIDKAGDLITREDAQDYTDASGGRHRRYRGDPGFLNGATQTVDGLIMSQGAPPMIAAPPGANNWVTQDAVGAPQVTNAITVNVSGAGDPRSVGQAVVGAQSDWVRRQTKEGLAAVKRP